MNNVNIAVVLFKVLGIVGVFGLCAMDPYFFNYLFDNKKMFLWLLSCNQILFERISWQ